MFIRAGNRAPVQVFKDDLGVVIERRAVPMAPDEIRVTTSSYPTDDVNSLDFPSFFQSFTHPTEGIWVNSSDEPPAWIESNWPELERKLCVWYDCPAGDPANLGGAPSE